MNSLSPNIQDYTLLDEIIWERQSLFVKDDLGQKEEQVLDVLGEGGCKKAIKLTEDRALLLPNMDSNSPEFIGSCWPRVVKEELKITRYLHSIGLLCPPLEEVEVFVRADSTSPIPSYRTETFANLGKTRGWYIIDRKNMKSWTWRKNFFNNDEDRLKEANWKPLIKPLIKDIAKLIFYQVPLFPDSINSVITEIMGKEGLIKYKIRYFGFDFSDKFKPLNMPQNSEKNNLLKISSIFYQILYAACWNDFKFDKRKDVLVTNLSQHYTSKILEKISAMQ